MAQPGKIEFSFWYSLAKWHRTVDRQPAAMRTCLKTAGKGNSTYCLQTWTHMSENAQNIAFFTRFVGAESAGLSYIYIYISVCWVTVSQTQSSQSSPSRALQFLLEMLCPPSIISGTINTNWRIFSGRLRLQTGTGTAMLLLFHVESCRSCWNLLNGK